MKRRHFSWFIILVALSAATLACQALTPAQSEGAAGQVLLYDDFSNPGSGWNRVSAAGGGTDYDDGAYRILVLEPNTDIWARPNLNFMDVQIEVDALKVGGARNNRFGVICRVMDNDNFYTFLISSDGYYGIGKVKNQQYTLLGMDALQPSGAIEQGTALNHVRADCIGERLSLYINGQLIAEAIDLDFPAGDVGLIAGTYDTPGTDILFDNFTVISP